MKSERFYFLRDLILNTLDGMKNPKKVYEEFDMTLVLTLLLLLDEKEQINILVLTLQHENGIYLTEQIILNILNREKLVETYKQNVDLNIILLSFEEREKIYA